MAGGPDQAKLHRALADERRSRIVDELRASPAGLDVQELAARLGLHSNTVRWHLGILADASIVASRPEARKTPGRPRVVFRLHEPTDLVDESYRLLATIVAGTLADLADGSARARSAGRAWGRYLVRRPPPNARFGDAEATAEIVSLLVQQGFRAETCERGICMRRCPFHELAVANPGIVCAVHHGLISGALAELGSGLDVERLDAFVEPELCVATLGPRDPGHENGER